MTLNYVTVTGTFEDGSGAPLTGTVTFTPSATVYAASAPVLTTIQPVIAKVVGGSLVNAAAEPLTLLATDNDGLTVEGQTGFWFWNAAVSVEGLTQSFSFFLPSDPSTIDLYALANTPTGGAGSGSVTSVAVETANGFAGTVADDTSTPQITLETSITGILKGNGTAISAATSGTDYLPPVMTTLGDIPYENATPAQARLAGNTSATKKYLTQTGTGSVSAAPAWGTIAAADLPTGTTSAQGALELDGTSGDIAAVGASASAGAVGKAADAGHVHVGLKPSNNLSDVSSESTALANLGGAPLAGATFTGAVIPSVSALTDAATILVNANLGNVFTVTLGGDRTLGAPSNSVAGQTIQVHVHQPSTGGPYTLAYASAYDFGTTGAPTLTVTASATDILAFVYDGGLSKWCYLGGGFGF